jgi:hypothetical protein
MAFDKSKSNKAIILCEHCGDQYTSLSKGICGKCSTPEKRAKLDEENKKIFEESGMEFDCRFCSQEKIQKESHNKFMEK